MEEEGIGDRTRSKTANLMKRLKKKYGPSQGEQSSVTNEHDSARPVIKLGGGGAALSKAHTTHSPISKSLSLDNINMGDINPYALLRKIPSDSELNTQGQREEDRDEYFKDFDELFKRVGANIPHSNQGGGKPVYKTGEHPGTDAAEESKYSNAEGGLSLHMDLSEAKDVKQGKEETRRPRYKKKVPTADQPLIYTFMSHHLQQEDGEEANEKSHDDLFGGQHHTNVSWSCSAINNSTPIKPVHEKTLAEQLEEGRKLEESSILEMLNENGENTAVDKSKGPLADMIKDLESSQTDLEYGTKSQADDHLTSILKDQFEQMNNRMAEERLRFQEGLLKTLQNEIATRFDEQSEKFKIKTAKYMADELIKWKGQTRKKADEIELGMIQNRRRVTNLEECQSDIVETLEFFEKEYENTAQWKKEHCEREELKLEAWEAMMKTINELQAQVEKLTIECNRNDRNWRKKSIRVSNATEEEDENCIDKMAELIDQYKLLPKCMGKEEISKEIDEAYRSGKKEAGRTRQIILKMKSTNDRNTILRLSKYKRTADRMKPVFLQEDLTFIDMEVKREANDFITQAFTEGKKPRFIEGMVKLLDNDGKRIEVKREVIQKYNQKRYKMQHQEKRHKFPILKSPKQQKEEWKAKPLQPKIDRMTNFVQEENIKQFRLKTRQVENEIIRGAKQAARGSARHHVSVRR
jgi:hypothetical protein